MINKYENYNQVQATGLDIEEENYKKKIKKIYLIIVIVKMIGILLRKRSAMIVMRNLCLELYKNVI